MADDFVFVDDVPEQGNPVPVSEFTCKTCGTPLYYSGRGRKPQYCEEHKKSRSTSAASSKSPAIVSRLITEIEMVYGGAGQALKFVDSIAGEMVYANRTDLAESWRLLLETNKRIRDMLAKVEGGAAWLPILATHGNLIAAIWFAHGVEKMSKDTVNDVSA